MVTEYDIVEATDELNALVITMHNQTMRLNEAKVQLAMHEDELLAQGVEGKNAETRKANLALATADGHNYVSTCQGSISETQAGIEQLRNVLRSYRLIIDLMSVE